jgi:hypothetical protein
MLFLPAARQSAGLSQAPHVRSLGRANQSALRSMRNADPGLCRPMNPGSAPRNDESGYARTRTG